MKKRMPDTTHIAKKFPFEITSEDGLREALSTLKPREASVICSYYGIDCAPHTIKEIASWHRLSLSRISRIKDKGIRRLQHHSRVFLFTKDRRRMYDLNSYGTLTTDVGDFRVFRISPKVFAEDNGFLTEAFIYDRRDERYKKFRNQEAEHLALIGNRDVNATKEVVRKWGNSDLIEGIYVG